MKTAIYPLSADPITNGHLDIIHRATKIFDKVVVAVGLNQSKKYLFSLNERTQMTKRVLANYSNVEVISFDYLLTDLAKDQGIQFVIRGFRDSQDYLYELNLYKNYLSQNPDLEFINLFSSQEFISSTAIKEIVSLGGDVHQAVPIFIQSQLQQKILNQSYLAITGEVSSGKTYLAKSLLKKLQAEKLPVKLIDFDQLGHEVLLNFEIVKIIKTNFSQAVSQDIVDRKALAKEVFNDSYKLKKLTQITHPEILRLFRQKIRYFEGLVILEIPLLAENNLEYLANNQIVMVKSEKGTVSSKFTPKDFDLRRQNQLNYADKKEQIKEQIKIKDSNFGNLFEFLNTSEAKIFEANLNNLIKNIKPKLNL